MRRGPRGGPGEFGRRLARAEELMPGAGAAREPLEILAAVLRHQQARVNDDAALDATARQAAVRPARVGSTLLDLAVVTDAVDRELVLAVPALGTAVPAPLGESGQALALLTESERRAVIETWLEDPSLLEPRLGFWMRCAAGPLLELAALAAPPVDTGRQNRACPVCGGPPQASVIAEESGEFMAGSPRSLVCGRCASWWTFPRITCPTCLEDDSRQVHSFLADGHPAARVDTCATCRSYIKTFDLREKDGVDVVPLVDDVATLTLDLFACDQGFSRTAVSVAGV